MGTPKWTANDGTHRHSEAHFSSHTCSQAPLFLPCKRNSCKHPYL